MPKQGTKKNVVETYQGCKDSSRSILIIFLLDSQDSPSGVPISPFTQGKEFRSRFWEAGINPRPDVE